MNEPHDKVLTSEQFQALMARAKAVGLPPVMINGEAHYVLRASGDYPEGGKPFETEEWAGMAYPVPSDPA